MKVVLELDDAVWWQLAERAEAVGLQVADIAAQTVTASVTPPSEVHESIVRLHLANKTVPEIARELGMTNLAVQYRLRSLGYRSNPRRKQS